MDMFTFQPISTPDCPQVAFDYLSLSSELRPCQAAIKSR